MLKERGNTEDKGEEEMNKRNVKRWKKVMGNEQQGRESREKEDSGKQNWGKNREWMVELIKKIWINSRKQK